MARVSHSIKKGYTSTIDRKGWTHFLLFLLLFVSSLLVSVDIPASILQLKAVSREMNFSSVECISDFRLVQSVSLRGQPLEEWKFNFGFVIPGSTNSWQCVIESAGEGNMIPPHVLSGHILIETYFYDGDMLVSTTKIRVFYT